MNNHQKIVYDIIKQLTDELEELELSNPKVHSVLDMPADSFEAPNYNSEKVNHLRDKIHRYQLRLIELMEN